MKELNKQELAELEKKATIVFRVVSTIALVAFFLIIILKK